MSEMILVLDFGGQYKELIAGAVRKLRVYSEIRAGNICASEVKRLAPVGIILTGGPFSAHLPGSPKCDPAIFKLKIPILGICYGMQMMCHMLGGEVKSDGMGEYGRVAVRPKDPSKPEFTALMSHKDAVVRLPDGFEATAHTDTCIAACENYKLRFYGTQFHPETKHTKGGREILRHFLYDVCGASGGYKPEETIAAQIGHIQSAAGAQKVLLALSGGVDSSVCAALLAKAIPGQLTCIFVDHGFMRENEGNEIEEIFSKHRLNFIRINAKERFLAKLKGVTDPERKRKRIGEEFIRVFEEEADKQGKIPYLAQGTIYPDIVESGKEYGATIKSHHNVGGLPDSLSFTKIIEPLSGFFKDEVRVLGRKLGLPQTLVNRQPFPGPGLAIRVIGEVTEKKLSILRRADLIVREEIDALKSRPGQYFAVLTDTRSVGVKGDGRTYENVIAIRAVTTDDFMTCDYTPLGHKVLGRISSRITNEINTVSRVVYDITSKPPASVEWE